MNRLEIPRWYDRTGGIMADHSEPYDSPPVQPSINHADHLEGTRAIHTTTSALEAAAQWRKRAKQFKTRWVRELMRRQDYPKISAAGEGVPYSRFELDNAEQEASAWDIQFDGHGNELAERQS